MGNCPEVLSPMQKEKPGAPAQNRVLKISSLRCSVNYLPDFADSQQQVSMSLFASVQWSFPFLPVSQQQEVMVFPVRVQRSAPSPLLLVVTPSAAIATSVIAMRFMVSVPRQEINVAPVQNQLRISLSARSGHPSHTLASPEPASETGASPPVRPQTERRARVEHPRA